MKTRYGHVEFTPEIANDKAIYECRLKTGMDRGRYVGHSRWCADGRVAFYPAHCPPAATWEVFAEIAEFMKQLEDKK